MTLSTAADVLATTSHLKRFPICPLSRRTAALCSPPSRAPVRPDGPSGTEHRSLFRRNTFAELSLATEGYLVQIIPIVPQNIFAVEIWGSPLIKLVRNNGKCRIPNDDCGSPWAFITVALADVKVNRAGGSASVKLMHHPDLIPERARFKIWNGTTGECEVLEHQG